MAATQAPNHRASLLSGLRTGGVRSMSGSMMMNSPHTAAPGGAFNVPRYASTQYDGFYEEEEDDMGEIHAQIQYNNGGINWPMTASVDGAGNRFSQQQSRMNANSPAFVPGYNATPQLNQAQAMQEMQMLQMEVMRLQAVQAQQYQAGVQANYIAEMLRQQNAQGGQNRRASLGFNPPPAAGPTNASFDLRSAALSAQTRRANQADLLKAQLGLNGNDSQVPMTAALNGKFGSRSISISPSVNRYADAGEQMMPTTPGYTTVISGGTPLGSPLPTTGNNSINNASANSTPSKSESAVSWRRNGNNNSVLSGNRSFTLPGSPTVKVTPPPPERLSPPPGLSVTKARPLPLRFSVTTSMSAVSIDASGDGVEAVEVELPLSSSSSSRSESLSPTTPPSSASQDMSLSPREEAAKKLYEGLGIGRPVPGAAPPAPALASHRMASQPMRQPRGPPSGADELGPKNFATRIRRKAIGGLGVLMGARERRISMIEEY